jgi:hypothetical protein
MYVRANALIPTILTILALLGSPLIIFPHPSAGQSRMLSSDLRSEKRSYFRSVSGSTNVSRSFLLPPPKSTPRS